jgi:serine/threonine protein kinase
LLGKGGMGAVYLAMDSQLNRKVALKIPFFNAKEEPKRAARFVREARSAASLHHPNICTVFDVGEVNGRPFITMAYIVGTPLEDLFDEDRLLPVATAVEIIRKMALALQKAHDLSIVHRDLKTANVMITPDGEPVVMDFGLAKLVGETDAADAHLTKEGAILGTPRYMAPEQVSGDQNAIGPVTDVYALGVMLFELLTGRAPYSGPLFSMLSQIASAPVPNAKDLRREIDEQLSLICRKAMAKAAMDRFASMVELEAALSQWASVSSGALSEKSVVTGVESPNTVDGRATTISGTLRSKPSGRKSSSQTLDGSTRRSLTSRTTETSRNPSVIAEAQPIRSLQSRVAARVRFLLADSHRIVTQLSVIAGLIILTLIAAITLGHWKRNSIPEREAVAAVSPSEIKDVSENPAKINSATLVASPPLRPSLSTSDARLSEVLEFQRPEFKPWNTTAFQKWIKDVDAMTAEQQVEAVSKKLVELNPGFDGKVTPTIESRTVTGLHFSTGNVKDISPVRALRELKVLFQPGFFENRSSLLSDLSPLEGMSLISLTCQYTNVSDLTPLKGMKLKLLELNGSPVTDLSALKGIPLEGLNCNFTHVSDLTPLKAMPLKSLSIWGTKVTDLTPLAGLPLIGLSMNSTNVSDLSVLKGMQLVAMYCNNTKVSDYSSLEGMPLRFLHLDFNPSRDTDLVRSIKTLETINDKPVADFWAEVEAKTPNQ